jgi:hypothetical protein
MSIAHIFRLRCDPNSPIHPFILDPENFRHFIPLRVTLTFGVANPAIT